MQSSPSPPPAPDPQQTANAQSGANIATAIANARLNRVNQQTPWGSITYTQGPADANGVPTWSSQIQLSPQQQALLEQQQGMQSQRNQIAQGYLGQVGRTLDFSNLHPIDIRGQQYTGAVNAPGNAQSAPVQPPQTPPPSSNSFDPALINQILAALGGSNGNGGSTPPPATTAPAPPAAAAPAAGANINSGAANNPLDAMLKGRPLHGNADFLYPKLLNVTNGGMAEDGSITIPDGMADPRTSPYMAGGELTPAAKQALGGKVQLRNTNIGGPGGVIDPSKVSYDPTFGLVTDPSNLNPLGETFIDQYGPWLMAAIPAAAMAYGAIAGEGAGAAGAGAAGEGGSVIGTAGQTGAFDVGGSAGFGGSTALQAGVPVTDLSVSASNPSLWQTAWNNLASGHGLLGLNSGQRAAVGLLPSLLRAMQSRNTTGGSK